ncbi:MAG: hypothetical protein IPH04_04810 [Saprospirales bacterium]|nr:hypothetical protein [Saprospirales bacterium]
MNSNFAILELKYGNIYGGFPNFFAIAEISLLVFDPRGNKVFVETWRNGLDIDYVSVFSKVNELGHTVSRAKEVINMKTGRTRPFVEEFKLEKEPLDFLFRKLKPVHQWVKKFLLTNLKKYEVKDLVTFDGRRDLFLCEKSGVRLDRMNIVDLQKDLNKETDYLFSLNKLSVIVNCRIEGSYLRSNNLEYWLHPIAAKQFNPKSAAWDAARLLMVHNEYRQFHDDFLIKAALLLNKIQATK